MVNKNISLEERLLASGLLTNEQLSRARMEAQKAGLSFEAAVLKLGLLSEEDISGVIAEGFGVPFIDIRSYIIDPDVIKLLPEAVAKKYSLIPLFKIQDTLTVAMSNPRDIIAIDEVRAKSVSNTVEAVLATRSAIEEAIEQYYGSKGTFSDIVGQVDTTKLEKVGDEMSAAALQEFASEAPIVKLVNMLITQALKEKASDIHIEPEETVLRIRYRVDGILREAQSPPKNLSNAIVSRIKVLARMDISEKRRPQDGRIQIKVESKDLDIRVSTFPTIHGENVVLRLLDKSSVLLGMSDIGFQGGDLESFEKLIRKAYGIVLVTGPTGSGKTTTLYSALSIVNSIEKNIITIEDPVEYQIPMIRQTQVNPKAGLTFANGLRSILRQDPDIIMVGEIRDKETADIAIQAALTGHLVLSTLHTNDACGTLTRLRDMGVEPFLVASSVMGVVAQRLVRVICAQCKEEHVVPPDMLKSMGIKDTRAAKLFRGKGCRDCKNSGYKGRTGIFETLVINDRMRELIIARAASSAVKQEAMKAGMTTLRDNGLRKAAEGITTVEEVLRATQEDL